MKADVLHFDRQLYDMARAAIGADSAEQVRDLQSALDHMTRCFTAHRTAQRSAGLKADPPPQSLRRRHRELFWTEIALTDAVARVVVLSLLSPQLPPPGDDPLPELGRKGLNSRHRLVQADREGQSGRLGLDGAVLGHVYYANRRYDEAREAAGSAAALMLELSLSDPRYRGALVLALDVLAQTWVTIGRPELAVQGLGQAVFHLDQWRAEGYDCGDVLMRRSRPQEQLADSIEEW